MHTWMDEWMNGRIKAGLLKLQMFQQVKSIKTQNNAYYKRSRKL
ncbi:hypothetical protein DOY81_009804 [Sarcophaga bullata]|nr:hypothetical protein DOY81_009804 [Sarcophaga bullata]